MENEKIAELISKKIYNVAKDETDFAIQLIIEKLIIPDDVKSYTADDAKKFILKSLLENDQHADISRSYTSTQVRELFIKLETERGKYHTEDAKDLVSLEEFLLENGL